MIALAAFGWLKIGGLRAQAGAPPSKLVLTTGSFAASVVKKLDKEGRF